jgi:hypothetical protein
VGAEVLGLWNNARLGNELNGSKTSPLIELAAKRFGLDLAATKVTGNGTDVVGSSRPVQLATAEASHSFRAFHLGSESARRSRAAAPSAPPAPPYDRDSGVAIAEPGPASPRADLRRIASFPAAPPRGTNVA